MYITPRGSNMKFKLTKEQWQKIGHAAGWMKKAQLDTLHRLDKEDLETLLFDDDTKLERERRQREDFERLYKGDDVAREKPSMRPLDKYDIVRVVDERNGTPVKISEELTFHAENKESAILLFRRHAKSNYKASRGKLAFFLFEHGNRENFIASGGDPIKNPFAPKTEASPAAPEVTPTPPAPTTPEEETFEIVP